jgi:lysophospholipase L1-like esterase
VSVFLTTNANVVWGGAYTDFSNAAGRAAREFTSHGAQFDLVATGTALTVSCYGNGDTLDITIDGGAPTALTPAAGWHSETLFTGLSDTAHTVRVKTRGTAGTYWDETGFLTLTGAAPALSLPSGFGSNAVLKSGATTYIVTDGSGEIITSEGNDLCLRGAGNVGGGGGHGQLRFKATTSGLNFWCYRGGDIFRVIVDDDATMGTSFTTSSDNTWGWQSVTGLDGGAEHQYQIALCHQGGAGNTYLASVNLKDGSFNTTTLVARTLWGFYGDSITQDLTTTDYGQDFPEQFCVTRKVGWYVAGLNGSAVQNSISGASAGETRTADLTGLSTKPTRVIVLYGHNDANSAGYVASSFKTSYKAMLNALVAGLPAGTKIYCLGILNTTASNAAANRTSANTQISAGVTEIGNPNVTYVSTDGWITPATDTTDGTHPNATGYTNIVTNLLVAIPAEGVAGAWPWFVDTGLSGTACALAI